MRSPSSPSASVSAMAVVVLPSPAFVGVIAVTQTSAPSATSARRSMACSPIFAL